MEPNNGLITSSKFEDLDTVAKIANAEWNLYHLGGFATYFKEMLQNFKRVAGHIYSSADLEKLREDERPDFVYPIFLPILLQLAGNFISSVSRVEASPKTMGDNKLAQIMTDMIDYAHYTANDLITEQTISYLNSIIGRVGWVAIDWRQDRPETPFGMMNIESYDPFRLMWDSGLNRRSFKYCNLIIDRGWYTPEEMCSIFASDDDDLFQEIMSKAEMYLGTDLQKKKLITYVERTFGLNSGGYKGHDQGYDEVSTLVGRYLYNNGNYFDSRGMFKVVEAHEKRQEQILTIYDPVKDEKLNISKFVGFDSKTRAYDDQRMQQVRDHFTQYGLYDAPIEKTVINQTYQTAVCPSFNIKLYDRPYAVQNGQFKYQPEFCFDFGQDAMEWKSYVDHLIDAVKGFNLEMNTMDTYLMRMSNGDTWAEEDALEEHEEAFRRNKINDLKLVKSGALSQNKIKKIQPGVLPPSSFQMSQYKKDLLKEITGVRDNALGTQESSGENGKLFGMRVRQNDILQILPQENSNKQLVSIGKMTKDYLRNFMKPEVVMRITRDETNPYWLEIYGDTIRQNFFNTNGDITQTENIQGNLFLSDYDITISRAPYGDYAKEKEFQTMLMLAKTAIELQRPDYVRFDLLIKNSDLRMKDEWMEWIKTRDQNSALMLQKTMADEEKQKMLGMLQQMMNLKNQNLEVKDKRKGMELEDQTKNLITSMVS